ncbi:ferrous iron transport protein A [Streptomyces sp. AC04842]|uniref:ferrous iron transport protein A n=1 Tax=Streptomyces sp. AC04842 TaxID=2775327 RepID=UPI0020C5B7FC|nr:ferrous iron transport protein A [Streptomyces sp. AC04842]
MVCVDEADLVDVDLYDDGSFPDFGFKQAPGAVAVLAALRGAGPTPMTGLATRRQLRAMGLSPGGQEPVARLIWRKGGRWAWLYRVDLAKPKRKPTLAQELALDKAMAARQTCPLCKRRYFACLPLKTLGSCLECHDGTPADPSSYIPPPAAHQLAA